jgi:hypothetical protein
MKYLSTGDKIKLVIDDGRFTYVSAPIKETYINEDSYKVIIQNYCTINDSIKIYYLLNDSKDSTFYANPEKYFICYIGSDINHQMLIQLLNRDFTKNIGSD